jgi:hypothetical protein
LLALSTLFIISGILDIADDTPHEYDKRRKSEERDDGVDDLHLELSDEVIESGVISGSLGGRHIFILAETRARGAGFCIVLCTDTYRRLAVKWSLWILGSIVLEINRTDKDVYQTPYRHHEEESYETVDHQ